MRCNCCLRRATAAWAIAWACIASILDSRPTLIDPTPPPQPGRQWSRLGRATRRAFDAIVYGNPSLRQSAISAHKRHTTLSPALGQVYTYACAQVIMLADAPGRGCESMTFALPSALLRLHRRHSLRMVCAQLNLLTGEVWLTSQRSLHLWHH